MLKKKEVESLALEVFTEMGLNWRIWDIQENAPSNMWDLTVLVSEHEPVIFSFENGHLQNVRESLRRHAEHRKMKLESNRPAIRFRR